MEKKQYSLITCIAIIVGTVIGSGIFFKSDNILKSTNGSVFLGSVIFILAAFSIIFGSLSIARLAKVNNGGPISYFSECFGPAVGCAFGWFQSFIYYPVLVAIISWILGIYLSSLLRLEPSLLLQAALGGSITTLLYFVNIFWLKIGAWLQTITTIIKLIPLILIAIIGLTFEQSPITVAHNMTVLKDFNWLSAVGAVAFSFDGWIVACNISLDIKNPQRNLPLALIIAPLIIVSVYIAYFWGISVLLGPEQVIALGDEHINVAAGLIFGALGTKIILIFVIVSILGTLNGLIIGSIRLPFVLSKEKMLPCDCALSQIHPHLGTPVTAACFSFAITCFWLLVHLVIEYLDLLPNSDISEIAIVVSYILYVPLYLYLLRRFFQKTERHFFGELLCPVLAVIGACFIFLGGMHNPLFLYGLGVNFFFIAAGMLFYKKRAKNNRP